MKTILTALTLIALVGCSSTPNSKKQFEPTIEDINTALQIQMWKFEIPQDNPKNLALRVIHEDKDEILSIMAGKPGEIVKIMIWPTGEKNTVNFCVISPSGSMHVVIDHEIFKGGRIPKNRNQICQMGDTLFEGKNPQGYLKFRAYIGTRNK